MGNPAKVFRWALLLLSLPGPPASFGELTSERRLLFHFDKIEVNGEIDVFLGKGKRNRETTVYADSEIIGSVVTQVRDRTLYLEANNTYELARRLPFLMLRARRSFPIEVLVSIDKLSEIRLHGRSSLTSVGLRSPRLSVFSSSTGRLHLEGLDSPTLLLRHEGAGEVVLKGGGLGQLEAQVLGDGTLRAEEIPIERALLVHKGKGPVHLAPETWLDARMKSSGNLILHRSPEKMVVDQTGQGIISEALNENRPVLDLNASKPRLERELEKERTGN